MTQRKSATAREKELKLAITRIEHGRTKTKVSGLSIAAVAREVGVSTALIHNHYPEIAKSIRTKMGTDSRTQRDEKQGQLKKERQKCADLRRELKRVNVQVDRLVSINEMLLIETQELRAKHQGGNVVDMNPKSS